MTSGAVSTSEIAKATFPNCSVWWRQLCTHYLMRTCVDWLARDGRHAVVTVKKQAPLQGPEPSAVRKSEASLYGGARNPLSSLGSPATIGQVEGLSRTNFHRNPCPREKYSEGPGENRIETAHDLYVRARKPPRGRTGMRKDEKSELKWRS